MCMTNVDEYFFLERQCPRYTSTYIVMKLILPDWSQLGLNLRCIKGHIIRISLDIFLTVPSAPWWRHDVETLSLFLGGIHSLPLDSPYKGSMKRSFDVSLLSARTSCLIYSWDLTVTALCALRTNRHLLLACQQEKSFIHKGLTLFTPSHNMPNTTEL